MRSRPGVAAAGGRHRPAPPVAWSALAVGSLTLGLVASGRMARAGGAGGPAVRLAVRLPEPLLLSVLALLALAALFLVALLFAWRRPRRRKDDDEFQLVYEAPKASPWLLAALAAIALAPVAGLGAILWTGWSPDWSGFGPRPAPMVAAPPAQAPPAPPLRSAGGERRDIAAPAYDAALGLIALVAALGSAGLMAWIFLGDRLARWWGAAAPGPLADHVREAVEEGLDGLRREPDPRRAVILCYRRFEQGLARSGLPRAPWETPAEFLRRALGRLPIPPEPTHALTRLFERSRFSHHAVGAQDRDAAIASLLEVKRALDESAVDAPAR